MLRLIIIFIFALFQFSSYSQCINEIHYDNTGGDLNEGFEIAGIAGTDLSCYDVVSRMETRIKIKSIQLY
jgi:hypothetical protein